MQSGVQLVAAENRAGADMFRVPRRIEERPTAERATGFSKGMEQSKDQPADEPQRSGVKKAHLLVPRRQASKSERNNSG